MQTITKVSVLPGSCLALADTLACIQGRRRAQRLIFIARSCPVLSLDAYALAAQTLKETTLDHALYSTTVQEHNTALNNFKKECSTAEHPSQAALSAADKSTLPLDSSWVDSTRRSSNRELDKLEVELKNYQNNLIKESIRVKFAPLRHCSITH